MITEEILNFLETVLEGANANISVHFAQKNKGIVNSPKMSMELKLQIIAMLMPYVQNEIANNKLVDYQALGCMDGEIERISSKEVLFANNVEEVLHICEISDKKFDWSKVDYYVIEVDCNNNILKLYRQFPKLRRLRKGLFLQYIAEELVQMDSDFIGLDETVDILEWKSDLLILNHIALERIFGYKDIFEKKTQSAMILIKEQNIFSNLDVFEEDCMRDRRIMKRFATIMQNERLPLFFKNIDKVPQLVKDLKLNLEFDENGKIIYSDRSQLYAITNLMSDSYFKSLLAARVGVAKLEVKLEE